MDFDFSEEQALLRDTVGRLMADRYDFAARNAHAGSELGWSAQMWAAFAELGLLAVPFAEEAGGIGGGPVETMIVMEAMGRALALEPYLATVVLSGALLRHGGSKRQIAEHVPAVIAGERRIAFAHSERDARYDLGHVTVRAKKQRRGWALEGAKSLVLDGDSADWLIVSARTGGAATDRDGIGLFLVDARAPGISRRGYAMQDARRAAEIAFDGVQAAPETALGDPAGALPLIERAVDEAIAALCAEAVGTMAEMHEATVAYIKERKQFGVPIGSFQVLQHGAVDMFVALEQARSMAMLAAMMAGEADAAKRAPAIAAAKVQIGRSGRLVGQHAIQLHGGMGMTAELKVGHCFKRATMIDLTFGNADHHLARLGAAGGLIAA
jgi:pimeloyl-CoA dehydrogenase small subunit